MAAALMAADAMGEPEPGGATSLPVERCHYYLKEFAEMGATALALRLEQGPRARVREMQ